MKMKLKVTLVLGSLLVVALAIYLHLDRPYIQLRHENAAIVVDAQTLGEYPTTVRRIRLAEGASGKVVFELLPDGRTPQITIFRLAVGDNSVNLVDTYYGAYKVVTPRTGNAFSLKSGEEYRLAMWGTGWLPSTVRFRLQ
jgi:hypothetical protein